MSSVFKGVGGERNAHLEEALDFGFFGFIGRHLHRFMRILQGWVGHWGFAIILMTLTIKLLLLPLTNKSFKSMQKMQVLKPMMDELKDLDLQLEI